METTSLTARSSEEYPSLLYNGNCDPSMRCPEGDGAGDDARWLGDNQYEAIVCFKSCRASPTFFSFHHV